MSADAVVSPGLMVLVATIGLASWWLRRRLVIITVVGESMQPTYLAGDRVLVLRTPAGRLRTGQVVVLEAPGPCGRWSAGPLARRPGDGRWLLKRVAATPGEPVSPDHRPGTAAHRGGAAPPARLVPPGRLVVLGDNGPVSLDSRQLGYVPVDRVLGVVLRRLPARSADVAARAASLGPRSASGFGSTREKPRRLTRGVSGPGMG